MINSEIVFNRSANDHDEATIMHTFIELAICCGVLITIASLTAFLATSAILGFLTVVGLLFALGHFESLIGLLINYRKYVDGVLFGLTLFFGVKLGITAMASVIFAGVFFSLVLRWGYRHLPKRKFALDKSGKFPKISIVEVEPMYE